MSYVPKPQCCVTFRRSKKSSGPCRKSLAPSPKDLAIEILKNAVGVNKNQVVEGRGVCDDNHRELNFPAVSKS